jgi:hypothetical protein
MSGCPLRHAAGEYRKAHHSSHRHERTWRRETRWYLLSFDINSFVNRKRNPELWHGTAAERIVELLATLTPLRNVEPNAIQTLATTTKRD